MSPDVATRRRIRIFAFAVIGTVQLFILAVFIAVGHRPMIVVTCAGIALSSGPAALFRAGRASAALWFLLSVVLAQMTAGTLFLGPESGSLLGVLGLLGASAMVSPAKEPGRRIFTI